jgi:hypothetical protein
MANASRSIKYPTFKPQKDSEISWDSFNGGLNTLYRPTELRPNELAQADNIMLVGKGTPTGRWGSTSYFLAGTGRVRLLNAFYNSGNASGASTNQLLAITDQGLLNKKTSASYTSLLGASFASGYVYQSAELGNNLYIANSPNSLLKYDGTNIIPYVGLSAPTNVSVAFLSGATGYNTYSWVITSISQVGETLGSLNKTITLMPFSMASAYVKVSWNTVSATASALVGYNIYRGTPGNERYLASVDYNQTTYLDTGAPASNLTLVPLTDTTTGPKAKYILKVGDRVVLAGFPDEPSKILVSGRYPYHDKFSALDGGGYAFVSPDDGDEITGIGLQHIQTTTPLIVIYKKYSTYVMTLGNIQLGNFVILDLQVYLLTASSGASSADTVISVENDVFSFGRKGLYSTGQEPQFLNQIRTNEISARIRPYVQGLSDADFKEATAGYIDYKYLLSFPSRKETMVYDYQRACFYGPWKTPFGITKWLRYFDSDGSERWLAGADDGYVYEMASSYISDSGTIITKTLRTRKEDFGEFNQMKMMKYMYLLFRNVRGQTNVSLLAEGRDGNTTVTKNFTLSSSMGSSGWGNDQWGQALFGDTEATVSVTGEELARYSLLFKQFRVFQIEVTTTVANSNFEFLQFKTSAVPLGPQSLPTTLKV